jgi:hypothetical protein
MEPNLYSRFGQMALTMSRFSWQTQMADDAASNFSVYLPLVQRP